MKLEICPACKERTLDLTHYHSMMVVGQGKALFNLACPQCHSRITALYDIPDSLREVVRDAAVELGAGMGREA